VSTYSFYQLSSLTKIFTTKCNLSKLYILQAFHHQDFIEYNRCDFICGGKPNSYALNSLWVSWFTSVIRNLLLDIIVIIIIIVTVIIVIVFIIIFIIMSTVITLKPLVNNSDLLGLLKIAQVIQCPDNQENEYFQHNLNWVSLCFRSWWAQYVIVGRPNKLLGLMKHLAFYCIVIVPLTLNKTWIDLLNILGG